MDKKIKNKKKKQKTDKSNNNEMREEQLKYNNLMSMNNKEQSMIPNLQIVAISDIPDYKSRNHPRLTYNDHFTGIGIATETQSEKEIQTQQQAYYSSNNNNNNFCQKLKSMEIMDYLKSCLIPGTVHGCEIIVIETMVLLAGCLRDTPGFFINIINL